MTRRCATSSVPRIWTKRCIAARRPYRRLRHHRAAAVQDEGNGAVQASAPPDVAVEHCRIRSGTVRRMPVTPQACARTAPCPDTPAAAARAWRPRQAAQSGPAHRHSSHQKPRAHNRPSEPHPEVVMRAGEAAHARLGRGETDEHRGLESVAALVAALHVPACGAATSAQPWHALRIRATRSTHAHRTARRWRPLAVHQAHTAAAAAHRTAASARPGS